jgi:hypothetical protein
MLTEETIYVHCTVNPLSHVHNYVPTLNIHGSKAKFLVILWTFYMRSCHLTEADLRPRLLCIHTHIIETGEELRWGHCS